MMLAAAESHPDIPVVLHQDHGTTPAVCIQSIRPGFTSVMMDGSLMADGKTPASYDYNVDVTRRVGEMAHAVGVSVEGELGCLGNLETGEAGAEDGIGAEGKLTHDMMLTDPLQAKDCVARTGVDQQNPFARIRRSGANDEVVEGDGAHKSLKNHFDGSRIFAEGEWRELLQHSY